MSKAVPKASLVRGTVPDAELPRLWQQGIAPYLDARPPRKPAAERPHDALDRYRLHQYHLGQFLLIDASFAGQEFHRDPAWMARHDDTDHLGLQLFVEGENHVQNGRQEFCVQPGNIFAVNLSREVHAASTGADTLTLILPRDLLRSELPQLLDSSGAIFENDSTSARVFSDHLRSLRRHVDNATIDEVPAITQGTIGLLDALTRHNDIGTTQARSATLTALCRHIDRHLADPELGPDNLCSAFRCSRATLYRLFKPLGGVHEHIQRRRLLACFKAITATGQAHRRIFDIAMDYGFVSPSHFSSLFRAHFGMTPRDARDGAIAGPVSPAPTPGDGDPATSMWQWAKTLTTPNA